MGSGPSKPTCEELEQRVREREDSDPRFERIEHVLHDVERRFRLSQKIARIGHVDYDVQTGAIYWSEMLYALYERDPAQGPPTYEEVMAMHSPEEAETLERLVSEAVETGKPYVLDLHVRLPSGRKATYHSIGIPQKDTAGKVIRIAGTVQDVTDQRQADEALRESQQRNVEILESIDDAFYAVDADWRLVYVNRRTEALWGRSREELVGTPLWELFPLDQETEAYRAHLRAMEARAPVYFETLSPNLQFRVDASIYPTEDGGLSVYFRDVSARKEAEAALQESERTFRSIFHDHAAVKLLLDPESGAVVEANRAAERFYGWSMAKLKTMRIQDINTLPLEQVRAEMKRARSLERSHFEFQHRLADGSVRDVEVYSSTIRAHGRDLLHSIIHDVSQRKRAERALYKAHEELEREVQKRTAELQAESDRRRY